MQKKRRLVRRRRLRLDRLLIIIILIVLVCGAVGWSALRLYELGLELQSRWQSFHASLRTEHRITGQLADKRFAGYTNILVLGLDDGNAEESDAAKNADTIIIASINNQDGAVRLLSIPGETLVNIAGRQNIDNVNKTYFYGEMQLTIRTLEESLYFPLHHYLVIDMQAFRSFIDMLGGIDLYVEEAMDYEDTYSGFAIHLPQGYQHLDGAMAEQYVRYRSDELGAVGRVQRQQRFVKALNEQLSEEDLLPKLPQLVALLREQTISSMAPLDIAELLKNLYGVSREKISIEMLPGEFVTINGRQHWQTTEQDKQKLLDKYFPAVPINNENSGG